MNFSNNITLLIFVGAAVLSLIAYWRPQSRVARWWHAWGRSTPSRLTPTQQTRWDGWVAGMFGLLSLAMALQIVFLERPDLRALLQPIQWGGLGLAGICLIVGLIHSLSNKQ